jgi:hypothetical protein
MVLQKHPDDNGNDRVRSAILVADDWGTLGHTLRSDEGTIGPRFGGGVDSTKK